MDAEEPFNAPNTLQQILDSVLRIEARLENASIVKRNRMQLVNNSGTTAYIARQKQVHSLLLIVLDLTD